MNKVVCDLTNCYGIQKLHHEFDFSNTNAISIYARNGLMKTSFSKTFRKIQEGKVAEIKDEIFGMPGVADVKVDGNSILPENVFVIKSFESAYESNSVTSLLVNDDIKARISTVLKLKEKFLKLLEKYSGLKITKTSLGKKVYELEPQIVKDFQFEEDSFLLNIKFLDQMRAKVVFSGIKYSNIFDSTVLKKITSAEFQEKIEDFCLASDKIYEKFGFLEKGNFTLPKLKNLSKTLESDSFFVKDNQLYLEGKYEIKEPSELKEKISEIEEKIKAVPVFQEIEKMLSDSKGIVLKELLENNPDVIPYLKIEKLDDLRKELWLTYLECEKDKFEELVDEYKKLEDEIGDIDLDATPWKKALGIFEERFTVPYKMEISNMKGAIIGESIPRVEFSFKRDGQIIKLARTDLENLDVLSQGEKRALYLLNIIFDIEKVKNSGKDVLFVVDDIADSFDYKNKYAIVEYLYEMSTNPNFRLLILSHNFDFYRTVSMRLAIGREDRLTAEIVGNTIVLKQEKYQNQPFVAWKDNLNLVNVVAMIPFVRNMIEFGVDKNVGGITGISSDYVLLTHLLHEKDKTKLIRFSDLKKIYKKYLGIKNFKSDVVESNLVIDEIFNIANRVTNMDVQLEHKIILAIAIRHLAERYMLTEIKKYTGQLTWRVKKNIRTGHVTDFLLYLDSGVNQTRELFNVYKQFGHQYEIKVLEEVNIMTPENIHLNSFMYEPILDMDISELLNLYQKVQGM